MKKSEEQLSEILDLCIERIQSGESPDNVLGDYPDDAEELNSLLGIAQGLDDLQDPKPHDFYKLMAESTLEVTDKSKRKPILFKPLFLRIAASVLIIFFLGRIKNKRVFTDQFVL